MNDVSAARRTVRRTVLFATLLFSFACAREDGNRSAMNDVRAQLAAAQVPAELTAGADAFRTRCSACHGELALGTTNGPPLIHQFYVPSHHSDESFMLAAQQGVRAHHWNFGDMPPVQGITREEVTQIVAYVRWLQRTAGLI